ncbi:MAG: hypothetical protein ABIU87_07370 [Ornithinibacter sp.]
MRVDAARGRELVEGFVAEATGSAHRPDPVLTRTGGPAGNAVLTAWTGLVLLVLFVSELLTLIDVRALISWHVAIGALLVPPALLKTATTGWRALRYYAHHEPYRQAGPPTTLLRWIGPLVVASTMLLLGSGVLLILLGEQRGRQELFSVLGFRLDWVTVHQGVFVVWCGAAGLHLIGRIWPALRLTVRRDRTRVVPAGTTRWALLAMAGVLAAALALVLVAAEGSWQRDVSHQGRPPPQGFSARTG